MDYLSIFQLNSDNGRVAHERNVLSIVVHAVVMEKKDGIGVWSFLCCQYAFEGIGRISCLGLFPKNTRGGNERVKKVDLDSKRTKTWGPAPLMSFSCWYPFSMVMVPCSMLLVLQ